MLNNIKNNTLIINEQNDKKIYKKLKKIIKFCDENNYKIKINNKNFKDVETAINKENLIDRYSFIYDNVCEYIDKKYMECNYCDFKDNVCVFFRNNPKIMHEDGCCYSDARGGKCEYLTNHKCKIKSISCKLYSCEYLRKNKVNFKINSFLLIKYFFNLKQKYYIKYSFFKPKDYVLYKLIESEKGVKNE